MPEVRITLAVIYVLQTFLADVNRSRYGYDLTRETGFPSGKLYPILACLQRAGWLIRETEDIDPAEAGRPARRLYQLSPAGLAAARREVAKLDQRLRSAAGRLAPGVHPEGGLAT
jgi:PadR family transcriptional regulator